jgi:hypothetical protein
VVVEGGIRSGRYERRRPCRKVAVLQKHSLTKWGTSLGVWCWRSLAGEAGGSDAHGDVDAMSGLQEHEVGSECQQSQAGARCWTEPSRRAGKDGQKGVVGDARCAGTGTWQGSGAACRSDVVVWCTSFLATRRAKKAVSVVKAQVPQMGS